MRIEAKTLEEAYEKAAEILNCSVADIDAQIIQYPSKGFFGLFAKNAIIEVEESLDIDKVKDKIKEELENLFEKSCFNVDVVEVSKYDEDTIFIKIDGEDAALLIGKDGYRYNALNYILYNAIHQKYGFKVRLEIAEFIKNQKEKLKEYLDNFIETKIKTQGFGKTRPLDGILSFLALEILRKKLPNKYIVIRVKNGERFVVVGEKIKKEDDENNSGNSNS